MEKQAKNKAKIDSHSLDALSIHTWVKDTKFRFASCSENVTELAGEDSPFAMKRKDDYSLIWQKDADFFRDKDIQIIKGNIKYINIIEVIDGFNNGTINKQKILITKIPLINSKDKRIGIVGSHIILPPEKESSKNLPTISNFDNQGRFWLPRGLASEYLTRKEVDVLRYILLGKTSKQIARLLEISYRTVEEYTNKIKRKFQCSSKYEIHIIATQYGITHLL